MSANALWLSGQVAGAPVNAGVVCISHLPDTTRIRQSVRYNALGTPPSPTLTNSLMTKTYNRIHTNYE